MDAIDRLANEIHNKYWTQASATVRGAAKEILRTAVADGRITVAEPLPEPSSLWRHKETGELRFVTCVGSGFVSFTSCTIGVGRWAHAEWLEWSANAEQAWPREGE